MNFRKIGEDYQELSTGSNSSGICVVFQRQESPYALSRSKIPAPLGAYPSLSRFAAIVRFTVSMDVQTILLAALSESRASVRAPSDC